MPNHESVNLERRCFGGFKFGVACSSRRSLTNDFYLGSACHCPLRPLGFTSPTRQPREHVVSCRVPRCPVTDALLLLLPPMSLRVRDRDRDLDLELPPIMHGDSPTHLDIPPPYEDLDTRPHGPYRSLSLDTRTSGPSERKLRALPAPPRRSASTAALSSAAGLTLAPARSKPQLQPQPRFFVTNPSDSPVSPASASAHPRAWCSFATASPAPAPGDKDAPRSPVPIYITPSPARAAKRNRRLGGVPPAALTELHTLGDGHAGSTGANEPPRARFALGSTSPSPSSSTSDFAADGEDAEDEAAEEEAEPARVVARAAGLRWVRWVRDLRGPGTAVGTR
ncbi:hypothetical protein B0H15DRAFT_164487 [Mycena belliarum]|uniref:Uncharacterized protein n=1 Tax=Mycena belliarum TaxID=1033014 RepID=A0AAD6XWI3_9AGAR|nr:hypothetical protein B0H15DRAFT_164487 [Mycena belliae]